MNAFDSPNDNNYLNDLVAFGNSLIVKGTFGDYYAIDIKINNKILIRTKYGIKETYELGKYLYKKLLEYITSEEIIINPLSCTYIGFIKKEKLPFLLEKFGKIKYIFPNRFQETFDQKIVYYEIKEQDTVEHVLDNVICGMEKIYNNQDVNLLKYDESFENYEIESQRIMNKFDPAIVNKDFIIYYQPKVDSRDNTMYGAEALVRWNYHGEIINPGRFIPVLENTSKICTLDFYILNNVCLQIKSWIEQGIQPVKISINFSRHNFKFDFFAERIINVINLYGIPAEYIDIELTESIKDTEVEKIKDFINKMHSQEISVSMDDFGSGYSSLSSLINLDVDTIKIDKSLIDKLENKKAFVILDSVAKVCKKLGIKTIAEGVETEQQIMMLDTIGYNIIQGYYYDKPLPENEFKNRMKKRNYHGERRLII